MAMRRVLFVLLCLGLLAQVDTARAGGSACLLFPGEIHRATGESITKDKVLTARRCAYSTKAKTETLTLSVLRPPRHSVRRLRSRPASDRLDNRGGPGPLALSLAPCRLIAIFRSHLEAKVKWQHPDCSVGVRRNMRGLAKVLLLKAEAA